MLSEEKRDELLERLNAVPDLIYHDTTPRGFEQAINELARIVAALVEALSEARSEAQNETELGEP